jgi:SOS response regulatory protein OraA/RecX
MPTVTALKRVRPGRVLVELDGARWRTFPDDVVAHAGLAVGVDLERPRARALARALRQRKALDAATRALRARDLPTARVKELLAERGIGPDDRRHALAALRRAGAVDDRRFAFSRAVTLAERGFADAAIRHQLEREGLPSELCNEALDALEPESVRATRTAARLGGGVRAARALARRGFGEEVIEAAVPGLVAADGGSALGYGP